MRSRRRNFRRRRSRVSRLTVVLILAACALLAGYIGFSVQLMPVLQTTAVYRAKVVAADVVNNAVGEVLENDDVTYDQLMTFEKDSSGSIAAVKADTIQINRIRTDVVREVIKEIDEIKPSELGIPLGTVIGGGLLSGRGPVIHIRIYPVGNVTAEISSEFTSAGINQTRQQINLDVHTDIAVVIPGYSIGTGVDSNFSIAESIIVGSVPNTVINGTSDSGTDKAVIYGSSGTSSSSGSGSSTASR